MNVAFQNLSWKGLLFDPIMKFQKPKQVPQLFFSLPKHKREEGKLYFRENHSCLFRSHSCSLGLTSTFVWCTVLCPAQGRLAIYLGLGFPDRKASLPICLRASLWLRHYRSRALGHLLPRGWSAQSRSGPALTKGSDGAGRLLASLEPALTVLSLPTPVLPTAL